ncbi:hypothetical protein GCM10011505_00680 [Tistrella bauzanensis]|uniref:Ferric oxidoreductase domain-containing protein n=1 Tax=Tistrella bauzanensis TaxID=657419 RepID=A0ABQ1I898_9PROT|nr:ferric reductase-like transmembrane domain-containing protein [Tistrella bauzanensis]GGB23334.1 hypothetical protein GCM10011505_00680 [Tistrella bauzanensis]
MRFPWNDPRGRFSPVKAVVLAGLFLPAVWILWSMANGSGAAPGLTDIGGVGPGPTGIGGGPALPDRGLLGPAAGSAGGGLGVPAVKEALLLAGLWAIRLLALSLLITPLRVTLARPMIGQLRRMIGVAAGLYALGHLALYILYMKGDIARVLSEIWLRTYLTIGFVAVLILAVLLATSTDGMLRRLGGRAWKRLHKLVYAAALLGALHYFMQTRLEPSEATILAGVLGWAALWRLADARRPQILRKPAGLVMLALAAGLLTVAIEGAWFAFGTGIDPLKLVVANINPDVFPRPAAVVTLAALAMAGLHELARRTAPRRKPAPGRRRQPRQDIPRTATSGPGGE